MVFTNTDKVLMMRAGRLLVEQAKSLKLQFGENWAASKESKVAKREYDRLLRDDRDIRALAKRLERQAKADDFSNVALLRVCETTEKSSADAAPINSDEQQASNG